MGGYLKGVWVELGHMVCEVHQARAVPCGTDGDKSHGRLSSWAIIPAWNSEEAKNSSLNLTFSSSSPHYCQGRKTEHIYFFNSGTPFLLLLGLYLC